ncbi:MAG: alpha-amylase family glycosyl hydrolase [Reichenbachiella sp.]
MKKYQRWLAFKITMIVMLLSVSFVVKAQDPAQYGVPFQSVPNRMDANIYQLNLREYSVSRDIAGARQKLQRIKDLGINVLYLMPVYPIGITENPAGSPYANSDLKAVATDLGTLSDLRGLVEDAHNLGIAVILDIVVNQTSWDHPWVSQHPDWYLQDGNGNILPPCPAPDYCFNDVAAIDLDNAAAADAMIDVMRYWIFAANIDGYRVDWADQAPQAFWSNAISNLRGISSHDLLMLAEGSNEGSESGCTTCGENQPGAHYDQGFDYIFGTNFYWNVIKKIWNSGDPVTTLDGVTAGEYFGASDTQLVARYLSNHDDYNAEGSPFSFLNGGRGATLSSFAVATFHRGVPFIYNGIEVGNTNPLPYPWNSGNINWSEDISVYTEMQKILNVRNASTALRRALPVSYIDQANTNSDIIAFTKTAGIEKVAVLVNVRSATRSFTIPGGMAGSYKNAFTGDNVNLISGQSVMLSPYEYLVCTNANVPVVDVTGVSITPDNISIAVGLSSTLSASVSPNNATNQNVTWTSSNPFVATVNGSGFVKGLSEGTATITVTTEDQGWTDSIVVNVDPASSYTVNFYKPVEWANEINVYYWDALPLGALDDSVWPGAVMTNEGDNWYSYSFTNVEFTNLIFNDGSSQSDDLERSTTGWYQNETWYNSNPGVADYLTGLPASVSFNSQAGNSVLSINSNVDWTVSDDSDWISVTPTSGSGNGDFQISVNENNGSARSANVTVIGNTLIVRTINISQEEQSTVDQEPYGGSPSAIPGIIELENFDTGGQDVAYNDADVSNNGGQFRTGDAVDLEVAADGGYNIGWTSAGEWTEYTVNISTTGSYQIESRVASNSSGSFHIEINGLNVSGDINVTNTGGWQNWESVLSENIELNQGTAVLRLVMNSGGFNIDKLILTTEMTCAPSIIIPYVQINGGGWNTTTIATVDENSNVVFGPQPTSGTWNWTGPSGFTSNARELALSNLQMNQTGDYLATYTNEEGCVSTQVFDLVVNGTGGDLDGFLIINRWQGTYLYDGGSEVAYGSFDNSDDYRWKMIDIDGHIVIQNIGTGDLMNIESQNGAIQCDAAASSYWSAQWALESFDGHTRIRNRWQGSDYVHVENQNGLAQHGNVYDGAHSGHWSIVSTANARIQTGFVEDITIGLYPNPLQDQLAVNFFSEESSIVKLNIIDTSGKTIKHFDYSVPAGKVVLDLDLRDLEPGVYILSIEKSGSSSVHRLIKE